MGEKELLVLGEGEVVATIEPYTADILHKAREYSRKERDSRTLVDNPHGQGRNCVGPEGDKNTLKVGRSFLGFYGAVGEVNLFMPSTSNPSLAGIVHIPQKTFPLIELMAGEDGLRAFYRDFFSQTEGKEWEGRRWNIRELYSKFKPDEIKGIPFASPDNYNWKLEKTQSQIFEDGRPLELQVTDYEGAVKRFITRLDSHVHSLNPRSTGPIDYNLAKQRFADLQQPNVKLIG